MGRNPSAPPSATYYKEPNNDRWYYKLQDKMLWSINIHSDSWTAMVGDGSTADTMLAHYLRTDTLVEISEGVVPSNLVPMPMKG